MFCVLGLWFCSLHIHAWSHGVPVLDLGAAILGFMKRLHLLRASNINLADKPMHEKAEGEQRINFKLTKFSSVRGAIKTDTMREEPCLSQMSVMPALASDIES